MCQFVKYYIFLYILVLSCYCFIQQNLIQVTTHIYSKHLERMYNMHWESKSIKKPIATVSQFASCMPDGNFSHAPVSFVQRIWQFHPSSFGVELWRKRQVRYTLNREDDHWQNKAEPHIQCFLPFCLDKYLCSGQSIAKILYEHSGSLKSVTSAMKKQQLFVTHITA